jgi:hypothetical protein
MGKGSWPVPAQVHPRGQTCGWAVPPDGEEPYGRATLSTALLDSQYA